MGEKHVDNHQNIPASVFRFQFAPLKYRVSFSGIHAIMKVEEHVFQIFFCFDRSEIGAIQIMYRMSRAIRARQVRTNHIDQVEQIDSYSLEIIFIHLFRQDME